MKYLLRDKDNNYEPCGIITSDKSSVAEIQEAICKIWEKDDYDRNDLEKELPDDCAVQWFDLETDKELVW